MNKKTIEPLPPVGSFPGYNRGAAVFNTWAQALLDQAAIMNDVWSKLKGGKLTADLGFQAVVSSVENTAGSLEDMWVALVTGSRPTGSGQGAAPPVAAPKKTARKKKTPPKKATAE